MKHNDIPIKELRIRNFKSIRDSTRIKLGPLTALIGNNGSGKSSLIEALEFMSVLASSDLPTAFSGSLGGPEHVWNKFDSKRTSRLMRNTEYINNLMIFNIKGMGKNYRMSFEIILGYDNISMDNVNIVEEKVIYKTVSKENQIKVNNGQKLRYIDIEHPTTMSEWVFLDLDPKIIASAKDIDRGYGNKKLIKDGSNLANYLLSFLLIDGGPEALDEIIDSMRYIVKYAEGISADITHSDISRSSYLKLSEGGFELPGWLFSSGTLRALAILSVLNDPSEPHLIAIEEIENGLDPRSLRLIINKMRQVCKNNQQIIFTTHSPYLLNLMKLDEVIIVERDDGEPKFTKFDKNDSLARWNKDFSLGDLYTMGRLQTVSI